MTVFRWICLNLLLAIPASRLAYSEPAEIDFRVDNGQINVPVYLNGNGPHWFIIDTGTSGFAFADSTLCQQLDLPELDKVLVSDGSGSGGRELTTSIIQTLRIGHWHSHDIELVCGPFARSMEAGERRSGMLGLQTFLHSKLAINYPAKTIQFGAKAVANLGKGYPLSDWDEIAYELRVEVRIEDNLIPVIIDTGASSNLNLPSTWMDKLSLNQSPKSIRTGKSFGNEYAVYCVTVSHPIYFEEQVLPLGSIRFNDHHSVGILGYPLLKHYLFAMDIPNRRVFLQLLEKDVVVSCE